MKAEILINAGMDAPVIQWRFIKNKDAAADVAPRAQDLCDLTGVALYLSLVWDDQRIDKNTVDDADDFALDFDNAILSWAPTLAETRVLPLGRIARWELEGRVGATQIPFGRGHVLVKGGLNRD